MYEKTLLSLTLITASLVASNLSDDAKKIGLLPIPSSQTELLKLIDNQKNPITSKKVELGKKLYFDPRLSKSGIISCNTCHNLSEGGDDGVSAAIGHKWVANPHHLNSPTVYNSVFFSSQFWDGRDPDLEKQAQGPIQAHPEMAATKEHVVQTVTSIPDYVNEFKYAYGDSVKISFEKITDTIATFERTLVTPSPYDNYLNGSENAITPIQKAGLKTFIDKGCATCHNGIALGGEMNAFNITGTYIHQNIGDFKGDKNGMVKVPTLRNITQTAPYFHNGEVWNLKEAIIEMGRIQVGEKINDKEAASIEAFLKALDGVKPALSLPILPASTNTTPKPDLN
ncbi:cytochrome-c peroxidase [Candidatus Sulfurimonas marisnigri]|uniref:Cytochrome-c peroxidase n=1 Tax=Candidatus Sulfurimonas marisnigri TaxID=2740405 RepID=A0A7S7M1J6_9BACT|nr:cytochrome-c peroxidase [Candidatus Sulfurimonas marisnigri]QOY54544.1 cytochrome-c peroxidase [Candidatus Sulfurimonas marisnigri]